MIDKHKIMRVGPNYRVECPNDEGNNIQYYISPKPYYCPECSGVI